MKSISWYLHVSILMVEVCTVYLFILFFCMRTEELTHKHPSLQTFAQITYSTVFNISSSTKNAQQGFSLSKPMPRPKLRRK